MFAQLAAGSESHIVELNDASGWMLSSNTVDKPSPPSSLVHHTSQQRSQQHSCSLVNIFITFSVGFSTKTIFLISRDCSSTAVIYGREIKGFENIDAGQGDEI